ncbi:bile acid:sodium symporter family protein [Nocardioides sp. KR10-350]|uniref:bile acid:sodium symporter family protein n=1 Tax=Nocardioides cheoyonin TaxID=3156615 RepID=UPI0032B400AB
MTVKQVGAVVGRWFPLIVLVAGAVALAAPGAFSSWTAAVPWLLTVIMLGMGMTLRPSDFAIIGQRPWALLVGIVAHYLVMPLLGWGIAHVLGLSPMLTAGMILVGSAPSGTASNVMVFLAKGDVALSVAMSSVSTLLAPVLTPVLVLSLVGKDLPVSASDLFVDIVKIVVVPVIVGLLLRLAVPRLVERVLDVLPLVSVAGITGVVLAVVAGSADTVLSVGALVVLAVVLHNGGGLTLGYLFAKVTGLPVASRRTVALEVGMQNSGLAAALATAHFSPVAALPAAIFSVWHNVSGSLIAGYWGRRPADAPVTEREASLSSGHL